MDEEHERMLADAFLEVSGGMGGGGGGRGGAGAAKAETKKKAGIGAAKPSALRPGVTAAAAQSDSSLFGRVTRFLHLAEMVCIQDLVRRDVLNGKAATKIVLTTMDRECHSIGESDVFLRRAIRTWLAAKARALGRP